MKELGSRLLLFAAVALTVSICASAAAADGAAPSSSTKAAGGTFSAVYVMGLLAGGNGKLQTAGPFKKDSIYSLRAVATYSNVVEGVHQQQLKFYAPDGSLYQSVATLFVARRQRTSDASTASVNGVPHPVQMQFVPPSQSLSSVWGELPVAGTWVQRLTGNWRVDVYLDKSEAPVGSLSFQIN